MRPIADLHQIWVPLLVSLEGLTHYEPDLVAPCAPSVKDRTCHASADMALRVHRQTDQVRVLWLGVVLIETHAQVSLGHPAAVV